LGEASCGPLLTYTLAPMHLSAFPIPWGSGTTTWEPTSSSSFTAAPCFRAEISRFQQPGTPQIQTVYSAMDPLLTYTLAPMHLSAFPIPWGSGTTTWEPTSSSSFAPAPCFRAEISRFQQPGTPQIQTVYSDVPARTRAFHAPDQPSLQPFVARSSIDKRLRHGLIRTQHMCFIGVRP
ncbi:hypothetical protein THAOC_36296, partial [Thalassiosira oceanica]